MLQNHRTVPAVHVPIKLLKNGRTGLAGEDDFELRTGSEDDGENWAGGKVLVVHNIPPIFSIAIFG
jgi:hypothetical protein